MTPEQLKQRTKTFAVKIVKFAASLPTDPITALIARQLVKSGTSVGANYRSSCRAKSRPDFIAKLTTAEEEADETQYWLSKLRSSVKTRPQHCLTKPSNSSASLSRRSRQPVASAANQQSKIDNKSSILNPQSAIRNPQSAIRNPQ
jgi:four helix bundle protein